MPGSGRNFGVLDMKMVYRIHVSRKSHKYNPVFNAVPCLAGKNKHV